ncbi:hypothetical protein HUU05_13405 [candidate division KSB1 bacterium]|nr:hypothetical protein [candidate division KSB1 bacterium]
MPAGSAFCQNGSAAKPAPAPAPIIQQVEIEAREIIDGSEKVPFSGLMNLLHIRTKKHVIRQELLFRERERYDHDLLYESARNLRSLGLFSEVRINALPHAHDSVKVVVMTRDRWTTSLNTSYKLLGGVHYFGIGLVEDNVLGLGKALEMSYNQSTDHILRQVQYRDTRLLGTRYTTGLKFQHNSDRESYDAILTRPFFAWQSRWGGKISLQSANGIYRRFLHGELVEEPRLRERNGEIIFDVYHGRTTKRHFMIGAAFSDNRIGAERRAINLVGAGFGLMKRTFREMTNLDNFEQIEDVPSGMLAEAIVGVDYEAEQRRVEQFYLRQRFGFARTHLSLPSFYANALLQTFYDRKQRNDVIFSAELKTFKPLAHHLLVLRAAWTQIANFTLTQSLLLDDENGLRGYSLRSRTGTRRLVLNLEDRMRSRIKVYMFGFGLAAFADLGNAWEEGEAVKWQSLQSSFGLGLRIGNSRFTSALNRLDVAYNATEKRFRISISRGSYFSAYSALNFSSGFEAGSIVP